MRASSILIVAAALGLAACSGTSEVPSTLDTSAAPGAEPAPAEGPATAAPAPQPQAAPAPPRPAPAPAPAPPPAAPAMITVPAGTTFDIELETPLSSGANQAGDPFSAVVRSPVSVDGMEAIPAGARVRGQVTEVKKAKRGAGHGSLTLGFIDLQMDGFMTNITATVSEETGGKKKRNAAIIGGSAAGGAVLGKVLGDDSKDAAIGALVGGAIGTGVVLSKKGEQVELPAGTALPVRLDAPVEVPADLDS